MSTRLLLPLLLLITLLLPSIALASDAADLTAPVHGDAINALVEMGEMEAPEGHGEEN